jgi:hypothetical protein
VSWTGAGDGTTWSDPKNWSAGKVPGTSDDVLMDVSGDPTIVYHGGQPTVHSLENHDTLWVNGANTGGDGLVNLVDYSAVRKRLGTRLPS